MIRSLLLIVFATLAGMTAVGAEITFRESATPTNGGLVRLGDVAEVRGADSRRLADLPLMPKPAPGEGQLVPAQAVREMLAAQGESPTAHRFGGAYFIRVQTSGAESRSLAPTTDRGWRAAAAATTTKRSSAFRVRSGVTSSPAETRPQGVRRLTTRETQQVEQLLTEAIQAKIDEQIPDNPEAPRFAVRDVSVTASTVRELLSLVDRPLDVRLPGPGSLTAGKTTVGVGSTSGTNEEAFRVVADLVARPMRVVATAAMQRDALIVASMVRLEPTPLEEVSRPNAIGYTRIAQVVGREAKRNLRPGDVLSDSNTTPPLMVERGEEVTVSSGGGGISVRMRAVAKQAGRRGDLVSIETLDAGETFMARVVGERRLAILSAGSSLTGPTRTGGVR